MDPTAECTLGFIVNEDENNDGLADGGDGIDGDIDDTNDQDKDGGIDNGKSTGPDGDFGGADDMKTDKKNTINPKDDDLSSSCLVTLPNGAETIATFVATTILACATWVKWNVPTVPLMSSMEMSFVLATAKASSFKLLIIR